jgi:hypothetical protein
MFLLAALIGLVLEPFAAAPNQGVGEPTGQKTLVATMNVYVFPNEGQAADQQSRDEAECYNWAVQNTGTDPFALTKQVEQQKQQAEQAKQEAKSAGKGAGAKGAVGGAAAGALIGEIASDDPGKGAAIGAGVGLIRGRRKSRKAKKEAEQQVEQQVEQAKAATQAFSVCLEAKNYMVKY